jgi:hypothetical protein
MPDGDSVTNGGEKSEALEVTRDGYFDRSDNPNLSDIGTARGNGRSSFQRKVFVFLELDI